MSGLRTTCRTGVRQPSVTRIALDNYQNTAHGHEFGGLSRVVMVRKTDQRIFASAKNGEEPKYETVTKETYETFRGNKTERKITSVEKRGVYDKFPKDLRDSLSPVRTGSPVKIIGSPNGKMKKTSSKQDATTSSPKQDTPKKTVDVSTFENDNLAAHNEFRAKHGVPNLKLNKQMCKVSQQWADKLASRGTLTHSQNKEYGENIYCYWTSNTAYTLSGREAVDSWYNEIKDHTFGVEPTSLKSGHFTQVIWKGSQELGVAYAKTKNGKYIVVANYYPPGNVIGSFNSNVPPVGGFTGASQNGV